MKKRKTMKTAIPALALLIALTATAQPSKELLNLKVVPPSPNAAALGKFGEIPVGTYTGTPNISVPLWNGQVNGYALPVSLSYHAGGVRVEEIAPHTGQGWAINAGNGTLGRTVRGLPDDQAERGWLALPPLGLNLYDLNDPVNVRNINRGGYDTEPDLFYFNCNGISGKFYLDKNGGVHQVPQTRIKIAYLTGTLDNPDSYGNITGWRLTDTDGRVYFFGTQEYSKTLFTGSGGFFPTKAYVSTWHLNNVKAPNGVQLASFAYQPYELNYRQRSGEILYNDAFNGATLGNRMPDQTEQFSQIELKGQRLQTVRLATGMEVQLIYDAGFRCDYMGDRALREVKILNAQGDTVKHYRLNYGYNGLPGTYTTCPLPANGSFASDEGKRLTLQNIEALDPATGNVDNAHIFEYIPMAVDRTSKSQDHWGFYNGAYNNQLVPPHIIPYNGTELAGANRGCYPAYSQQGALKKITWPTGGTTALEYENHRQGSHTFYNLVSGTVFLNGMEPQPFQSFSVVNDQGQPLRFRFRLQGFPPSFSDPGCWLRFKITDAAGANTLGSATFNLSGPQPVGGEQAIPLNLATGNYRIYWEAAPNHCPVTDPFSFDLRWNDRVASDHAGGLRIKAIRQLDGLGGSVNRLYRYVKENGSSSGVMMTIPRYAHIAEHGQVTTNDVTGSVSVQVTSMLVRSATSNLPLTYTQGAPVAYSRVEELTDSNGVEGKTVYHYTTTPDAELVGTYPYTPMASNEWQRGLLTKQETFVRRNGQNVPLRSEEHTYGTELLLLDTALLRGVKVGQIHFGTEGSPREVVPTAMYNAKVHYPQTGRIFKTATLQTLYDSLGNQQVQRQLFETDPHYYNITKVTTWLNNTGTETEETLMRYPWQAAQPGMDAAALEAIAAQNRLNEVVERSRQRNGQPMERQRTHYGSFGNGHAVAWLPARIETALGGAALKTEARINLYDSMGNVLEQQLENGKKQAYLYGYRNTYPIAEAIGAGHADMAYTSFETDATGGGWSVPGPTAILATAPTGQRVYDLNGGALSRSVDAGKTYIVSCWTNGAITVGGGTPFRTGQTVNGFTYREYKVSGTAQATVSGSGQLDELRLYPEGAQMTTLTYLPGVGATSQSDMNGIIVRYEYDGLGRLRYIKDMWGKVVKAVRYGYRKGLAD